jgi:menaquinone-specific isochorismate synthase
MVAPPPPPSALARTGALRAHAVQVAGAGDPLPDPARFLAAFEGSPRGFWGRGERWVAWGQALAEVVVPAGATGRFEAVRAEVMRLVGDAPGESAEASRESPEAPRESSPRLFGGFAFLDDPAPNGSWQAFPPARFILPRVRLEGGPEGARLVVQGTAGDAELAAEASGLISALRDAGAPRAALPTPELPALEGETAVERGEDAWSQAVEAVLAAEREGTLEKAVLARTRDVTLPGAASIPELLRFLRHENPRAHVFVFEPEPGQVLFGAAPEVLAELRGGRFQATAVAGSAPRGRTAHEEQLFAGGLLASAKDRAEHRMTLDEMVEVLTPRLASLQVPAGPGVLRLARIQHLETPIAGEAAPGEDILGLVEALHPTPAVCGRPRGAALALIRRVEPFERGWYAGPVGWLDASGDGDFVPALRIGVGGGARWRLYAGAGIVEGSDPHSEWEETALKFEPAHRALRAAVAPAGSPEP